jgi:hypothetical protein
MMNLDSHYDVTIIGAGPFGATAAKYATEDASVPVIEKKSTIGVPVQCAGFLPKYGELAELMPDSDLPGGCVYAVTKYQRFIAPAGESGDNVRSIEMRPTGNEVGTHEIESEGCYQYRGSPKSPTRYDTLTLVVDDHDSTPPTPKPSPGLAAVVVITGSNHSGMLIGLPFAILYFLARKITAEGAEERRAFNHFIPLRAHLRTLRLYSPFDYSMPHVLGSSCIVRSQDSGLSTRVVTIGILLAYVRIT